MPIEHVRANKRIDAGTMLESFAYQIKVTIVFGPHFFAQDAAKLPPEFGWDVLDRVEPEAIEVVLIRPPGRIVDQRRHGLGLGKIEGRHVRLEPGRELVIVPTAQVFGAIGQLERAEPVAMLFPPGMLSVDVMQNEICNHFQTFSCAVLISDLSAAASPKCGSTSVGDTGQ